MSNLEQDPLETVCVGTAPDGPVAEFLTGRDVVLGGPRGMKVTRTLPNRDRRMVGAWCFIDYYGPETAVMRLPPHPHTGLQTVSWLVQGEILHRDSVGSEQLVKPGQLNLMTAGRAISHSEESPGETVLHGVQLWIALPDSQRKVAPHFEHHQALPELGGAGASVTVILGELGGATSPAQTYTPLVGAEINLDGGAEITIPLRPDFEHALLGLTGAVEVAETETAQETEAETGTEAGSEAGSEAGTEAGTETGTDGGEDAVLEPGPLLYLGSGRDHLSLRARRPARLLLIGGEPFEEEIIMWWNFVGRTHEEIAGYREEWTTGTAFGTVDGFDGAALPAPTLPVTPMRPRGRRR
ncbi:pirin family protein [Planotetraspora phitsanulokensis]|nr:pirin family protein [Planotetraspora phitsanulokensis]